MSGSDELSKVVCFESRAVISSCILQYSEEPTILSSFLNDPGLGYLRVCTPPSLWNLPLLCLVKYVECDSLLSQSRASCEVLHFLFSSTAIKALETRGTFIRFLLSSVDILRAAVLTQGRSCDQRTRWHSGRTLTRSRASSCSLRSVVSFQFQ